MRNTKISILICLLCSVPTALLNKTESLPTTSPPPNNTPSQSRQDADDGYGPVQHTADTLVGVGSLLTSIFNGLATFPISTIAEVLNRGAVMDEFKNITSTMKGQGIKDVSPTPPTSPPERMKPIQEQAPFQLPSFLQPEVIEPSPEQQSW